MPLLKSKAQKKAATTNRSQPIPTQIQNQSVVFSTFLLQDTLLMTKQEQLESKIKEVKSGIKFGAILPASEKVLEAEKLKIRQQLTEIKFDRKEH
jgi:hypothetical protein